MPEPMNRIHLEDNVWAMFDGYHIAVFTDSGQPGDPSNHILLSPHAIESLWDYRNYLITQIKGDDNGP